MKKFIIIACAFVALKGYAAGQGSNLLAVPTYTQVNKIKGGLFGYKSVSTGTDTNGNTITNCQNPGRTKCTSALVVGSPLTSEDMDNIDKKVNDSITPDNLSGQFVYNTNFLVVYSYDVDSNKCVYSIYTKDEAAKYGYSF